MQYHDPQVKTPKQHQEVVIVPKALGNYVVVGYWDGDKFKVYNVNANLAEVEVRNTFNLFPDEVAFWHPVIKVTPDGRNIYG
jgi:hypothetical protein